MSDYERARVLVYEADSVLEALNCQIEDAQDIEQARRIATAIANAYVRYWRRRVAWVEAAS